MVIEKSSILETKQMIYATSVQLQKYILNTTNIVIIFIAF